MHLKKLELVGFKSFPEKTQFVFNEGITCIVGPNGCGKTNLLDALRWVLGEQKTSLLRGNKMEEVIFAGTRTLKPLGMSEVSLHIENRDGIISSPYNEISISRRLFRSGESEYLLNKVPCRLKDITDLFADTGLGSHAYAIIQQDMIDAILSDRAEERRFLFEEAAGITKYKQRKKAAERKLEATEQDLLRLQDILAEINSRVNSLKRQVNKAERYKKISDELKNWNLYLAQTKYAQLQARKKELSISLKSFEDQKIASETKLDVRFTEMEQGRAALTDLDHQLSQRANKVYELSEKAHEIETGISVNREKRENLQKLAVQNRQEIEILNKRAEVIREEQTGCRKSIEQAAGEIARVSEALEKALADQKIADDAYLQFRGTTDEENARLLDLEGKISSGRADSAGIDEQVREMNDELRQLSDRKNNLNDEKNRRRQEITRLQDQINQLQSETTSIEESISSGEQNLNKTLAEADRLRDLQAELAANYEAVAARKDLLAEMVEHHEGYEGGVVAVFEIADRWLDITGTVADFIHPNEGCRTAVEAALGQTAQYILCQNRDTAHEAINHLRDKKAGRASFLILEKLPENVVRPDLPHLAGIVGWADQLVTCEERYNRVPLALLGQTVVCEDAAAAQRLHEQLPHGYRIVTLQGNRYEGNNLISGGGSEELPLTGRRDELEALAIRLHELEVQLGQAKKKQSEENLKIGELRQTQAQLSQKLIDTKESIGEQVSRIKEEQFKVNAAEEVTTSIDQRIEQLTNKAERLKQRQYTLALDFDQLGQEKAGIAEVVRSKREQLAGIEQRTHQAADEVNRLQVARIEWESKHGHYTTQLAHYEEMLTDINANNEQKKQQIEQAEKEAVELVESLGRDEILLKELFDRRQGETVDQQELRLRYDSLMTTINELETQVKGCRKEKELATEEMHKIEISLTEIDSKVEQLEERTRTEYEMDVRELHLESPDPSISEEETVTRADKLRENLRDMGIVNLLALEEYTQQKERQQFLSRQLDDLISAKGTLKATIQKINQTAKMMFLETMEKAKANFKKMFEDLFTGGEADIILIDPTNPLESPIEIISRPRGKKPLTITQLSGGERALTAISLLFALYMVKPSPFCFLDEIDAPLDDINVGRFLTIVRKFSRQTQFIIITHNKITMEAADTLYGVTMEEPGVSKVVAVRFKKESDGDESGTILEVHYAQDNDLMQAG